MSPYVLLFVVPLAMAAPPTFTAERTVELGVEVVRLGDTARGVSVGVATSIGNRAFELSVHGKNLLYFPTSLAEFKAGGGHAFNGIPFLAPWANRIPGGGFWANGKRYNFNTGLGNLSLNPSAIAIHGMLTASPHWELKEVGADEHSAHVTSRLEFWRYPDLMANWPFAQEYEMTYRLNEGGLEITTVIKNLSNDAMPVAIGFHPYFNIPDVPRAEWSVRIPARKHIEMDSDLLATGQLTDVATDRVSLNDHKFDDGFTDLVRDSEGHAAFAVEGGAKKIEVVFGPKYGVGLIYAPPNHNFVCFEPMTAVTNALNLFHDGKYSKLQTLLPGSTWQESFEIRFSGF